MADMPEGFIPEDQFQAAPPAAHIAQASGFIPEDQFESSEEAYGTPGQMAKTALEGAAEGVLGPIAPAAERLMGVKAEDIRGRHEENPITHGVGQAVGLGGSMLAPGLGVAGVMGKAGEAAVHAIPAISEGMEAIKVAEMGVQAAKSAGKGLQEAELALKAAKATTPLSFKVGASAVTQAAEMAVLQGSDEVSKLILQDPDASAQSAIANIGLAAALGAGTGSFLTGAVSPLWEATAGPKVEAMLSGLKNHLNGNTIMMPEELAMAQKTLGMEIPVELKAVISGNPTAISHFNVLKEGQHKGVTEALDNFHTELSNSVSRSLGIAPEDIAVHSENEAGHELLDVFKKEYDNKYGPIAEAFEKRNAEAATISISDDARLHQYGRILEDGMAKVGTDSPVYEVYKHYGERLLAKDTVGGIDMLKTEIGGEIEKAMRAGDTNRLMALREVRTALADFQESQISRQAEQIGRDAAGVNFENLNRTKSVRGVGSAARDIADKEEAIAAKQLEAGAKEGKALGAQLINERAETNRMYKEFAQMSGELTDHLGTGRFTGAKGLTSKLSDKISAEQLMNKFSFKGNADFIPFLQKHFPEVFEKVRENELKRFLKPAVLSAKGESPINIKKLGEMIEKGMAGQKEYIGTILPKHAIESVAAASKLSEALPNLKSSGTAGWLTKMFADMPRSAMAAVAMLNGHNMIFGGLLGEMAQRLGRDAPDAIRLAHLKFLGSNQPIKAESFKAMVDFFHNTYKGENMLAKSTTNLFKAGAEVVGTHMMPKDSDRDKLDKQISKLQDNPQAFVAMQKGQLGHYLPNHQQAVTQAAAQALQYLQGLKPHDHILGPLDKPVPPQPVEIARYNRALDIAHQPAIVMQHIKDGTLQRSDIEDLHNMFPALYAKMSQNIANEMTSHHSDEEPIPYKTRIGLSLFLGQPVDATMSPQSILAAQPMPKAPPQQMQDKGAGGKSMKSLGKSTNSYRTPTQTAENDRAKRD